MDMADAVNIMAHGSALWHIFASDDANRIRQVLKQHHPELADAINSHRVYLTPKLLDVLQSKGIKPFTFEQKQGDCVFIPAGCAHQVNLLSFFCLPYAHGLPGVQHNILHQNSSRFRLASELAAMCSNCSRVPQLRDHT